MSGAPAITKVLNGLVTRLTGNVGTGVNVITARAYDEPFQEGELPCVEVRAPQTDFNFSLQYNALVHDSRIIFDIHIASKAGVTIDAQQAEIAAAIVARLAAVGSPTIEAPTVGTITNMVQICDPVAMGVDPEEANMSDHGVVSFVWRLVWITDPSDFTTITGTPTGTPE